jgi:hypothetical protein
MPLRADKVSRCGLEPESLVVLWLPFCAVGRLDFPFSEFQEDSQTIQSVAGWPDCGRHRRLHGGRHRMAEVLMSARISRFSLIVFVVLLVLSIFLKSIAGDYWPWYAVMAVFAVVPLIVGPHRYRLLGAVALVLSVILIVSDCAAGRHLRKQQHVSVENFSSLACQEVV